MTNQHPPTNTTPLQMTHQLTDEMCESICQNCHTFASQKEIWFSSMRAAYDIGYAQAFEDVQDAITCIQRKDSIPIPMTLKELEALRLQQQENN